MHAISTPFRSRECIHTYTVVLDPTVLHRVYKGDGNGSTTTRNAGTRTTSSIYNSFTSSATTSTTSTNPPTTHIDPVDVAGEAAAEPAEGEEVVLEESQEECNSIASEPDCDASSARCSWICSDELCICDGNRSNEPVTTSIVTVGPGGEIDVPCVFPFVYKGVEYSGCTEVDSPGTPWCATGVAAGTITEHP